MYCKAESVGVASHIQAITDSGGSSPSEDTGKLKSVVQVVSMENIESSECDEVKPETAEEDMETVGGARDDGEGDGVKGEGGGEP